MRRPLSWTENRARFPEEFETANLKAAKGVLEELA